MRQIILIRHAETVLVNMKPEEAKITLDPLLSVRGEKQAEELKDFVKKFSTETIFTSLYKRSRQTAQIINNENVPVVSSNAFNEYYVDPNGKGIETTSDGASRSMSKIYSALNLYEDITIVAHSSINQTILQNLLNLKFDEARTYFNKFGETQVLRYDWKQGDTNWRILETFIPKQD